MLRLLITITSFGELVLFSTRRPVAFMDGQIKVKDEKCKAAIKA